jgi:hypothetical protein
VWELHCDAHKRTARRKAPKRYRAPRRRAVAQPAARGTWDLFDPALEIPVWSSDLMAPLRQRAGAAPILDTEAVRAAPAIITPAPTPTARQRRGAKPFSHCDGYAPHQATRLGSTVPNLLGISRADRLILPRLADWPPQRP